ncbi:MAG: sulfatase family protein [Planctomycetota bacterium]|jgi:N-acetylglucosamine-6-sulfatase
MSIRTLAGIALAAATTATASPQAEPSAEAARRPNIVFIMADDHCMQAISCYGASAGPNVVETPGIDRIAREGMRFDRASVTNAICGPSRATILTGKHCHQHGFATNGQKFDGSQQTFPKLLQQAGYRTEVVGKWHLSSPPSGFDRSEVLVGQGDYWNPLLVLDGKRSRREGHTTDLIHQSAVERLEAFADDDDARPFLLMVHHKAPHRNWMPHPRHLDLFTDGDLPVPDSFFDAPDRRSPAGAIQTMQIDRDLAWLYDLKIDPTTLYPDEEVSRLDRWMTNELARVPQEALDAYAEAHGEENAALAAAIDAMSPRELALWKFQRYAKNYLRTAQGVDDSVGGILEALDRLDLADDTIVVYTSDQGWYLGEQGWYDKRWMYEPSFRTPLVVRWPGVVEAGSTSDALAQNLDFASTFLEAAGVAPPADLQGRSLVPVLRGESGADETLRDAAYYRYEESRGAHTVPRHEGVATREAKLIRYLDLLDDEGDAILELYRLDVDPEERDNLAGRPEHADLERSMLDRLDDLRASYQAPENVPAPTPRPGT